MLHGSTLRTIRCRDALARYTRRAERMPSIGSMLFCQLTQITLTLTLALSRDGRGDTASQFDCHIQMGTILAAE